MLRCKEVTRLIASDDIRTSSLRKRLAVRMHLMFCRHCRRYVRELRRIAEAVRELAKDTTEDAGRYDALVRRVLRRSDGMSG